MTFLCIGGIAFGILVLLINLLPKVPSINTISIKNLPKVLKRPALLNIYLLTAIIITGHFTAYTYITPFMMEVGGFSQEIVVHLLLVIGFSGMIGSVIFTRYASKYPTAILVVPVILLMACLLSLYFSSFSLYTAMMQGVIWGLAITIS